MYVFMYIIVYIRLLISNYLESQVKYRNKIYGKLHLIKIKIIFKN